MAKRAVGWPQAALTIVGFGLTMIFGVLFVIWFLQHKDSIFGAQADPIQTMTDVWLAVRWALLGMALFTVSWLWSLNTNRAILRFAQPAGPRDKPPLLA